MWSSYERCYSESLLNHISWRVFFKCAAQLMQSSQLSAASRTLYANIMKPAWSHTQRITSGKASNATPRPDFTPRKHRADKNPPWRVPVDTVHRRGNWKCRHPAWLRWTKNVWGQTAGWELRAVITKWKLNWFVVLSGPYHCNGFDARERVLPGA